MTQIIPLTQGQVALIDDDDLPLIEPLSWSYFPNKRSSGYAKRTLITGGVSRTIFLHRFLMDAPEGIEVDHKDRNGLNCVRSNMRLATKSQNMANRRMLRNNTSGFRGVSWNATAKKWMTQARLNNKRYHLGLFSDIHEAALAHDAFVLKAFGEFSALNFPIESSA